MASSSPTPSTSTNNNNNNNLSVVRKVLFTPNNNTQAHVSPRPHLNVNTHTISPSPSRTDSFPVIPHTKLSREEQLIAQFLQSSKKGQIPYFTGWDTKPNSTLELISELEERRENRAQAVISQVNQILGHIHQERERDKSFENEGIPAQIQTDKILESIGFGHYVYAGSPLTHNQLLTPTVKKRLLSQFRSCSSLPKSTATGSVGTFAKSKSRSTSKISEANVALNVGECHEPDTVDSRRRKSLSPLNPPRITLKNLKEFYDAENQSSNSNLNSPTPTRKPRAKSITDKNLKKRLGVRIEEEDGEYNDFADSIALALESLSPENNSKSPDFTKSAKIQRELEKIEQEKLEKWEELVYQYQQNFEKLAISAVNADFSDSPDIIEAWKTKWRAKSKIRDSQIAELKKLQAVDDAKLQAELERHKELAAAKAQALKIAAEAEAQALKLAAAAAAEDPKITTARSRIIAAIAEDPKIAAKDPEIVAAAVTISGVADEDPKIISTALQIVAAANEAAKLAAVVAKDPKVAALDPELAAEISKIGAQNPKIFDASMVVAKAAAEDPKIAAKDPEIASAARKIYEAAVEEPNIAAEKPRIVSLAVNIAIESAKFAAAAEEAQVSKISASKDSRIPQSFQNCILYEDLQKYASSRDLLSEVSEKFKDIKKTNLQFYTWALKAIATPLNQNSMDFQPKLQHFTQLFSGKPVTVPGVSGSFVAGENMEYLYNLFAARFLKKSAAEASENEIKRENLDFLAKIGVELVRKFPDLKKFIQAHFYKCCPFLAPFSYPRKGRGILEYAECLEQDLSVVASGKNWTEGQLTQILLGNLSGYCGLWCYMVRNMETSTGAEDEFFSSKEAWTILTKLIRLEPQMEVTAAVLNILIETIGKHLEQTYLRRQFHKWIKHLKKSYISKIRGVTPDGNSGSLARLEIFLDNKYKHL